MSTMVEAVAMINNKPRFVPPNPERSGYHWLRRWRGGPAVPFRWNAEWHRKADNGWGAWSQPDREDQWEYLGPCPSPDDAGDAREPVEAVKNGYSYLRANAVKYGDGPTVCNEHGRMVSDLLDYIQRLRGVIREANTRLRPAAESSAAISSQQRAGGEK